MKRKLFITSIVAALCAVMLVGLAGPAAAAPTYSNGFEADTAGWSEFTGYGTIDRQPSGYLNTGGYASGITSTGFHARLERGACDIDPTGGGGPTPLCYGPYTNWGGDSPPTFPVGGYTTQVDIFLDATYADANADDYDGNLADLTAPGGSTNPAVKGTRFDYSSAINDNTGTFLRDFGFNVSTGLAGDNCSGFTVIGTTNVTRSGANPNIPGHDPQCIPTSGWYTFKHTFSEVNGYLNVLMEIIPVGSQTATASWNITGIDPIDTVGCERYGWFVNQEIWGLPIDNASMTGCGTPPLVPVGVIAPTATTCQQYANNETTPITPLEQLQYNTKGTNINAVSPGVFFYYTKFSGDAGDKVDITEINDAITAPAIPINQGQVVLYDAGTCKVVKGWTPTVSSDGTATGTLPKDGDFIIGVKYNPSALKGKPVPNPTTVTYTFGAELDDVAFDAATIDLVPKA